MINCPVRIEAGDAVKHLPTGETWHVLGVDRTRGKICVAGWPPTITDLADCELVNKGHGIDPDELVYRTKHFGGGWE